MTGTGRSVSGAVDVQCTVYHFVCMELNSGSADRPHCPLGPGLCDAGLSAMWKACPPENWWCYPLPSLLCTVLRWSLLSFSLSLTLSLSLMISHLVVGNSAYTPAVPPRVGLQENDHRGMAVLSIILWGQPVQLNVWNRSKRGISSYLLRGKLKKKKKKKIDCLSVWVLAELTGLAQCLLLFYDRPEREGRKKENNSDTHRHN